MRHERLHRSGSGALILTCLLFAASAEAQGIPPCDDLPDEPGADVLPKLYIESGDTQEPLVQAIGRKLQAETAPNRLRVIYRNRPTCLLRDDIYSGTKMIAVTDGATQRKVRYLPLDGSAALECAVPNVDTDPAAREIELGIGATFFSSCDDTQPPAGITMLNGPVQPYGFITNPLSSEVAITAEEGYLAFGFTEAAGDAKPWIVQNLRFRRGPTASTTLVMSAAIGLLPSDMNAAPDVGTSDDLARLVHEATANPNAVLGILGTELYDGKFRENDYVKFLAFKGFGQRYAYFPDSTSESYDKQNVRDGHYLPWAPTPYAFKTSSSSNARRFFDLVMGRRTVPDVDGLASVVAGGLVPECAMKVMRDKEGGDLSLYDDPEPCHCYFETNVTKGSKPPTCIACDETTPCASGTFCRKGFCEAR